MANVRADATARVWRDVGEESTAEAPTTCGTQLTLQLLQPPATQSLRTASPVGGDVPVTILPYDGRGGAAMGAVALPCRLALWASFACRDKGDVREGVFGYD